jgi:hypothetical protein
MGLKGHRLWVMGQLDSTCSAPLAAAAEAAPADGAAVAAAPRCSAAGCVLERQTLKPVFSLDRI